MRGAQVARFLRKPEKGTGGALIFGEDAARVSDARALLIRALAGEGAEEEMRIARVTPSDLRDTPSIISDELRATGFFPGPRVVHVDGITETQAKPVLAAVADRAEGDAALVVTAGNLKKGSKIRKAFEAHPSLYAVALFDDPMTGEELTAAMADAGVEATAEGRAALEALAVELTPGAVRQVLEKVALYADGPADAEAVRLMAPATVDAEADAAILAAAEGRVAEIGPLVRRLAAQGVTPVTLVIGATRHFQMMHGAAAGAGSAWGRHRDAAQRQARAWGARRIEAALAVLMDADLTLRSASKAPQMPVAERALLRLASMAGRG
nr:DNA polymerase III subunit delta [Jannaschia sp. Os4]